MRVAPRIELDAGMARALRALSRRRRVEARVQQRARVILLAAAGWRNKDIATEVALDRRQVALWRQRFLQGGIDALRRDAPRPGRTPVVTQELESRILRLAAEVSPGSAERWSARALARHFHVSATTIRRVCRRHGLRPASRNAAPAPGLPDRRPDQGTLALVGLSLDAPRHVLVLGIAPGMGVAGAPAAAGAGPDVTTTGLAGALDAVASTRVCRCAPPPPHEAGLRLLKLVDRQAPRHLALHLFVEDDGLPRHPEVAAWLASHPRIVLHAAGPRASWRQLVARFLRGLRAMPADPGGDIHAPPPPPPPAPSPPSSPAPPLAQALQRYLADRDAHRAPFVWPPAVAGRWA